jgi:selenoprotein W-related protein
VSLTAEVLKAFEFNLAELTVVPGSGGVFEVEVNGELVFSKKQLGRHAATAEVIALIRERLPGDAHAGEPD